LFTRAAGVVLVGGWLVTGGAVVAVGMTWCFSLSTAMKRGCVEEGR